MQAIKFEYNEIIAAQEERAYIEQLRRSNRRRAARLARQIKQLFFSLIGFSVLIIGFICILKYAQ